MKIHRLLAASALLLISLAGCGGSSALRANVSPAPMPTGGSFTGVWQSTQYGEMHMRQTGAQVIGEYTKDERRGTIQGTVQGNLMRFAWEEKRELVSGRPTITRGRGYFQYVVESERIHNIVGEWGHDSNEIGGGPWTAYKLRRRQPHLSTDPERSDDEVQQEIDEENADMEGSSGSDNLGDLK